MSTSGFFAGVDAAPATTDDSAAFANALNARFGPGAIATVIGHGPFQHSKSFPPTAVAPMTGPAAPRPMLPVLSLPSAMPIPPRASPPTSAPATATNNTDPSFTPTAPAGLSVVLDDPQALVIDIRPHAAFANARLPHALSLSVPSTLLKRPLFSLARLAEMLPIGTRARFINWNKASRILIYDTDTAVVQDGSNLKGLLRKFIAEGCPVEKLTWLQGGFQTVWRHHRQLVETDPPSDEEDEAQTSGDERSTNVADTLRTRNLPRAAFTASSTTNSKGNSALYANDKATSDGKVADLRTLHRTTQQATESVRQVAFNPFYDAIRQNTELSQGITERIPLRLSPEVRARAHELPFPWLREIVRRSVDADIDSLPVSRRTNPEEGAEALAMQFYRIELAEQRRLTGVMQHHSKEGALQHHKESNARLDKADSTQPSSSFPYSITAGVEKGAKNRCACYSNYCCVWPILTCACRYRNIWPFEHARVKLCKRTKSDDDYVNASYVQPLGTTKKYVQLSDEPVIATKSAFVLGTLPHKARFPQRLPTSGRT
jgi:hypothetical protein